MVMATCATLLALLAQARGGETITLRGDCPAITIRVKPRIPVTVDATGSTVRGLSITGGNIRWRGGTFRASGGALAAGPAGYGVLLREASNVRFDNVLITDARKGVVVDAARGVTFADNRFLRLGEDGIIASRTAGLMILRNRFAETIGKPTRCTTASGVVLGLSGRACLARGGSWADGFHRDAVQMRNGVTDALLEGNVVEGETQGLTQMDTIGDAPLERVTIRRNTIRTSTYHPITLGNCIACVITGNAVARMPQSTIKAIIHAGLARECGNVVQDARSKDCAR